MAMQMHQSSLSMMLMLRSTLEETRLLDQRLALEFFSFLGSKTVLSEMITFITGYLITR